MACVFEEIPEFARIEQLADIADCAPQRLVGPGTGGSKLALSFAKAISIGFKSGE